MKGLSGWHYMIKYQADAQKFPPYLFKGAYFWSVVRYLLILLALKCHPCSIKDSCLRVWLTLQMSDRKLSEQAIKGDAFCLEVQKMVSFGWHRSAEQMLGEFPSSLKRHEDNARGLNSSPALLSSCTSLHSPRLERLQTSSLELARTLTACAQDFLILHQARESPANQGGFQHK